MDFGALSPEVNSGLMYSGPGSAPMLAAATAWHGLAAELRSAATGYGSAILDLADAGWQGPSSAAMAAAAAPYVAWMHSTAAQAEHAGMQAATAAAAHEAAFAATVPPPVIAANRTLLMSLVATNVLGHNTPAIAATQAHYGEMWAQDAAAMYAYAGSSAAASMLTPVAPAPPTTNATGLAGVTSQVVASAQATVGNLQGAGQGLSTQPAMGLSGMQSALNSSTSTLVGGLPTGLGNSAGLFSTTLGQGASLGGLFGGPTSGLSGLGTAMAHAPAAAMRPAVALPGMVGHLAPAAPRVAAPAAARPAMAVSAGMGQATPVGRLSVPPSWATPAPAATAGPAATALPAAMAPGAAPLAGAGAAAPMLAPRGIPAGQMGGMEAREYGAAVPRVSVLPRSLVG